MTNQEQIKGLIANVKTAGLSPAQRVDYWTAEVLDSISYLQSAELYDLSHRLERLFLLKDQLNKAITAKG